MLTCISVNVIAFCVSQFLLKFIKSLSLPLVFCCVLTKFCPLSLQRWPHILDGGRNHSLLVPASDVLHSFNMHNTNDLESSTQDECYELQSLGAALSDPLGAVLAVLTLQLGSGTSLGQSPHLSASYYRDYFYGAGFSTASHLDWSGT